MAKKIKEITIEELMKACKAQIKAGNGKKKIIISGDDEGNSFHVLYYLFTATKEDNYPLDFFEAGYIDKPLGVTDKNVGEYIILG